MRKQSVNTVGMRLNPIQDFVQKAVAQSQSGDTCLVGANLYTGETFMMGIGNFRYRVIWSLREENRKRPKSVKAVGA